MFRDTNDLEMLGASLSFRSGDVVTCDFEVDCLDGYSLFGEALADVAVELKHVGDVSWTDIETTPYDVSAYDGSTENFQLRVTVGTITIYDRVPFTLTMRRPT